MCRNLQGSCPPPQNLNSVEYTCQQGLDVGEDAQKIQNLGFFFGVEGGMRGEPGWVRRLFLFQVLPATHHVLWPWTWTCTTPWLLPTVRHQTRYGTGCCPSKFRWERMSSHFLVLSRDLFFYFQWGTEFTGFHRDEFLELFLHCFTGDCNKAWLFHIFIWYIHVIYLTDEEQRKLQGIKELSLNMLKYFTLFDLTFGNNTVFYFCTSKIWVVGSSGDVFSCCLRGGSCYSTSHFWNSSSVHATSAQWGVCHPADRATVSKVK